MIIDRLIARIEAALRDGASAVTLRALAEEYAARCADINMRLESCLPLLRAGQKYATLQIAEAPPPLLDSITRLAFEGMDRWRALCAEQDLPVAPLFDADLIARINELYGEQIDENHPLYRDYRAAMRLRDEIAAFQVLNAILRINPDDANAQSERLRLLPRIGTQLESLLRQAVDAHEFKEIERLCALREQLALEDSSTSELWKQAKSSARESARMRAEKRGLEILELLEKAYAEKDWQTTVSLLAEWESLDTDFSEAFRRAHLAKIESATQWAEAISAQRQLEQTQARQIARARELLAASSSPDGNENGIARQESELSQWETLSRESQASGLAWPEPLGSEVVKRIAWLRRRRDLRRTWLLLSSAIFFVLLVAAAVAGMRSLQGYLETNRYFGQLNALKKSGELAQMETLLQTGYLDMRQRRPEEWETMRQWQSENAQRLAQLKSEVQALSEKSLAPVIESKDTLKQAQEQAQNLRKATEVLPAAVGAALTADIDELLRKWDNAYSERQARLQRIDRENVQRAETLAAHPADLTPVQWEEYKDLSQQLRMIATSDNKLKDRANAVVAAFETQHDEFVQREYALEGLPSAATFESYFELLKALASNPMTPAQAAMDMGKALKFPELYQQFLKALVAPEDDALWNALQSGELKESLAPQSALASENLPLSRLFGEKKLESLYERMIATFNDSGQISATRTVYTTGQDIEQERNTWSGGDEIRQEVQVINSEGAVSNQTFRRIQFLGQKAMSGENIIRSALSDETALFLKLRRYFDSKTQTVRGSLLEGLDIICADEQASPLFKAALHLRWIGAMRARPALWGASLCPQVAQDAEKLALIVGDELGLYAFVSPEMCARYERELANFYRGKRINYAEAARQALQEKQKIMKASPQYAGYWRGEGGIKLIAEAQGKRLWFMREGEAMPVSYEEGRTSPPPAYTAFFSLPKELEQAVIQTRNVASAP